MLDMRQRAYQQSAEVQLGHQKGGVEPPEQLVVANKQHGAGDCATLSRCLDLVEVLFTKEQGGCDGAEKSHLLGGFGAAFVEDGGAGE